MEDLAATLLGNDERLKKFAEKELKIPVRQKAIEMIHQMELADEEIDADKDELQRSDRQLKTEEEGKYKRERKVGGYTVSKLAKQVKQTKKEDLEEIVSGADWAVDKFGDDFDFFQYIANDEIKRRGRLEKQRPFIEKIDSATNFTELKSALSEIMKGFYGTSEFKITIEESNVMLDTVKRQAKTHIDLLTQYNPKYHQGSLDEICFGKIKSGRSAAGECGWDKKDGKLVKDMSFLNTSDGTIVHEFSHSVYANGRNYRKYKDEIISKLSPEVKMRLESFGKELSDMYKDYKIDTLASENNSLGDESRKSVSEFLGYAFEHYKEYCQNSYAMEIGMLFDSYFDENSENFKTDEYIKNKKI